MMNTVIQRMVLVTSFLASFSSYYAYLVRASRGRMAVMAGPRFLPLSTKVHWTTLFRSAIHCGKDETLAAGILRKTGGAGKDSRRSKLSAAGDWLAPVIVWFLVISMGLAIVGFLLGER